MAGIVGMGQPQDIQSPVPNVAELAQQSQADAATYRPDPSSAAAAPQALPNDYVSQPRTPSLDDIFGPSAQSAKPSLDDIFGPSANADQSPKANDMLYSNTAGLPQQIADLPTRSRAAFATTDKERLSVLKDKFGEDNVKVGTEKVPAPTDYLNEKFGDPSDMRNKPAPKDVDHKVFLVRDKKGGDWRTFGSANEILGDAADLSRMAFEAPVQAAVTGAGMAAAGAAGLTGVGLPASPVIAGAAAGAGVLAGKKAGDVMAQNVLGIPRDPARSELLEDAGAFGIGALMGGGAQYINNKIATRAALGKIEQAGIKATTQAVQDNLDAATQLQKAGLVANIPGQDTNILAHEAAPNNPQLLKMSLGFEANSPEYRSLQEARAANLEDGYKRLSQNFGNPEADSANLHGRFQASVRDIDHAEGVLLGKFRDNASASGNKQPLAINQFSQAVGDLAKSMGFSIDKDMTALTVPDVQTVIRKGIVSSPKEAAQLVGDMNNWLETLQNSGGKLSYADMLGEYKAFTQRINSLSRSNGPGMKYALVKVKDGMRDDINMWTGNLLQNFDPEAGELYKGALDRFSTLKNNQESLNSLLKGDSLNAQAFADRLFYNNKAPGMVDAVKSIIGKDDPRLWDDLVGAFFNNRIADNKDLVTGRVNWTKVNNDIFHPTKGVGDEVLGKMLGSPKDATLSGDLFAKFGKFAATFNERTFTKMAPQAQEAMMKELGVRAFHAFHGRPEQILRALTMVFKTPESNHIAQYISKVGTEQALGIMPQAQESVWRKVFDGMTQITKDASEGFTPR